MNPYASYLGNRDPLEVIAATPDRLANFVQKLGPEGLKRSYAPGKWPARVILYHLADAELAFAFRFRQALAEPHHVIQPFDQDEWARSYVSEAYSAKHALEAFSAVRQWNLGLLKNLPKEAFAKPVTHPERGAMTFRVMLETMAGHDLNHLRQFEAIAAAAA
jgi:uncharacterized damage-inducible protein DinB